MEQYYGMVSNDITHYTLSYFDSILFTLGDAGCHIINFLSLKTTIFQDDISYIVQHAMAHCPALSL